MSLDIGDIYSVEIPASDGHEQAGTRPAIIVQDADSTTSNRQTTSWSKARAVGSGTTGRAEAAYEGAVALSGLTGPRFSGPTQAILAAELCSSSIAPGHRDIAADTLRQRVEEGTASADELSQLYFAF